MFDFSQVGPTMPRVPEPEHNKLRDILGNAAHDHIGEFGADLVSPTHTIAVWPKRHRTYRCTADVNECAHTG
jgi:hypothetical protein